MTLQPTFNMDKRTQRNTLTDETRGAQVEWDGNATKDSIDDEFEDFHCIFTNCCMRETKKEMQNSLFLQMFRSLY